MSHFALLNINKPRGQTSRWVVDQVQRLVRPAKAGHAGTLDPLATGVLVVCLGPATRLIEYVQQMPKRYCAEFLLGRTSPTEDTDGDVTELDAAPVPTREAIESAAQSFVGEILQRPPAFSALKVSGRRAYQLARKGHEVELAPRPVTVHSLTVIEYSYPRLVLDIHCGSGTYVRSLGRDLAQSLGTGAVMSALERTAIGNFCVEDAVEVQQLTPENLAAHLLPPHRAVDHLPVVTLDREQLQTITRGQAISYPLDCTARSSSTEFAAVDVAGNLAAIVRRDAGGQFWPMKNW